MELTKEQLALVLGIYPEENLDDIKIIIKNTKTDQIINEINIDELFEGLIKLPVNLERINADEE